MAMYRWRAVDQTGRVAEGEMEASSQTQVVERLRLQGRLLVAAEPVGAHLLPPGLKSLLPRRSLSHRDTARLFRQLSILLKAGLPLDRALDVIGRLGGDRPTGRIAVRLHGRVRAGASLADAMESDSGAFTRIAIGMVRAGEAAGALDILANRVAEMNGKSMRMRDGVAAALLYPLLLLAGGLGAAWLLSPLGPEGGGRWGWALVAVFGVALAVARRRADSSFRLILDRRLLHVPQLGQAEAVRVLRGLSTMLAGGVPPVAALGILRECTANASVAATIAASADSLRQGRGLAAPLGRAPWFPRVAVRMVAAGEEAGKLEETAARAADLLDTGACRALGRALEWLTR